MIVICFNIALAKVLLLVACVCNDVCLIACLWVNGTTVVIA